MCLSCFRTVLPPGSLVFALLGGIRVGNVCSEALEVARKRQVLSKIHLIAKRSGILGLDACVAQ